jgi:uncharacterized membrane protein YcaP (DUF421 family)
MLNFTVAPWELVLRSVVIYVGLLLALRLFGKREVGQFTLYDLVLILLVANAVQPAMTGPDTSLAGGLLIIATLVLVNLAVGRLDRWNVFHRLFAPQPSVIIRDGHYLPDRLRREGVTEDECESAIREHGLSGVSAVRLGVLEPDGSISIVPMDVQVSRTRRRVRYRRRGD